LLVESAALSVLCTLFLFLSNLSMALPIGFGFYHVLLLFCCGIISIIPLALFSCAAKRLTIISMGMLQFVLPITQFFVATVIYSQAVSLGSLIALLVIMCGMLLVVFEPILKKIFSSSGVS
jgi:chloramphenicol-sensitive protein RarD